MTQEPEKKSNDWSSWQQWIAIAAVVLLIVGVAVGIAVSNANLKADAQSPVKTSLPQAQSNSAPNTSTASPSTSATQSAPKSTSSASSSSSSSSSAPSVSCPTGDLVISLLSARTQWVAPTWIDVKVILSVTNKSTASIDVLVPSVVDYTLLKPDGHTYALGGTAYYPDNANYTLAPGATKQYEEKHWNPFKTEEWNQSVALAFAPDSISSNPVWDFSSKYTDSTKYSKCTTKRAVGNLAIALPPKP